MDRRTFLNQSELAKVAATAASSMTALMSHNYAEAHALMEEAQRQMHVALGAGAVVDKTAVSRKIHTPHCHVNIDGSQPDPYCSPLYLAFEIPHGFIPTHVDSTYTGYSCYELEIIDDEGVVLRNLEDAFNNGSLQLWRPVVGKLCAVVTYIATLSCLPPITVTIYGSLPKDQRLL